jgi:Bacterial Ig-like domain
VDGYPAEPYFLTFTTGPININPFESETMTIRFVAAVGAIFSMCSLAGQLCAAEHSVASLPALVVKTEPQAGLTEVDPNTKEIKVTYSRKMLDKSWSWGQISDETAVKSTGKPRYLKDGKTCVLPVKLEPGKTYAVQLNALDGHLANFKDERRQPAVAYLLVFETRKSGPEK